MLSEQCFEVKYDQFRASFVGNQAIHFPGEHGMNFIVPVIHHPESPMIECPSDGAKPETAQHFLDDSLAHFDGLALLRR